MRVKISALIAAGILLVNLLCCLPAMAHPCDASISAQLDSSQADLTCPSPPSTDNSTLPGKKRTGEKSVKPACVWVPEPGYQPGPGQKAGGSGGGWYRKFCSFGKYNTLADFESEMGTWDVMNMRQSNMMNQAGLDIQWFVTPPAVPRRTPVWLTDKDGQFVPDLYQPTAKTIELEGYPLKWQIVPALTISPGAGSEEQTCDGAGVPWSASADGDPSACTVTYDRSGQYTLSANVGWTVQWWLDGVPQEDIPGPTNTATRAITVLEIHALDR
ncbi:hypothetical protein [Streptomyces sp. SID13031]|uniref:hypothetical protein n=1 Tax=Streptomyces sp. SID13031 TaxID=2706046 RepID=UPI0013CAC4FA|nr:hypothetical protein [Streptomyces sp. SID13031]NEA36813.1 hypothetical protein [Streptomyces sp. SID13031]